MQKNRKQKQIKTKKKENKENKQNLLWAEETNYFYARLEKKRKISAKMDKSSFLENFFLWNFFGRAVFLFFFFDSQGG